MPGTPAIPYPQFGQVYEQRRRAAAGQRDATLASNAYARTLATQRGQRDLLDFNKQQTAYIPKMSNNFYRRGLQNSGIYGQAQKDFAGDWMTGQNDIMSALQQKLDEYNMQDAGAMSQYQQTAADLEAQKMNDILAMAAQLKDFQSIGGGA